MGDFVGAVHLSGYFSHAKSASGREQTLEVTHSDNPGRAVCMRFITGAFPYPKDLIPKQIRAIRQFAGQTARHLRQFEIAPN